ncbi:MAG: hypothetical protein NVSMB42_00750 [Herpetosiphon sp.]
MLDKEILNHLRMFSSSRRHFLKATTIAGSLVATASTLAPTTIAGVALAESAAQADGDLGILNYALTLEHFENALYKVLIASGLLTGQALEFAKAFGAHESAHVTAITETIKKLGGTPVQPLAAYNLPALKSQAEAIATITKVEDVGASAYLGAAPLVKNNDVLTAAVEIHTVEAEHATAWRFLNGENPVPFGFAPPRTKQEILDIVTPFLSAPAAAPTTGGPSSMPNTGAGDQTLKYVGLAGGVAAIAAGAALARDRRTAESE